MNATQFSHALGKVNDPADLFVEVGKFLIGQTDDDLVGSASHGFSFLRGHRGGKPLSSCIVISQYVAC